MKRHNTLLLITLALAATLLSCERKTLYSHFTDIDLDGWTKSDTVTFCVTDIPQTGFHDETLCLRTTAEYPFQSLTLVVQQSRRADDEGRTDTLSLRLVDSRGNPTGDGVSLSQHRFPLRNISLETGDTLRLRVWHIMKRETLPGVVNVGLTVKRQ